MVLAAATEKTNFIKFGGGYRLTTKNMLDIGRDKVTEAGLDDVVTLELGDATSLQLNSSIYDKITISFGIRNIPDIDGALREMRRVAKQGALLGVLEFA